MSRDEELVKEWLSKNEVVICDDVDDGGIRNFKYGYNSTITEYFITGNLVGDMAVSEHDGVHYSTQPESDKRIKNKEIKCMM